MDKISSILAPSARVTSVDLDESPPARPGSPNIGQKQGVVRINDRFNLSQRAKELAAKDTMMKVNPRELSRAKIAEAKSQEFFMNRIKPKEEPTLSEKSLEALPPQIMAAQEKYSVQQQAPIEDLYESTQFSIEA